MRLEGQIDPTDDGAAMLSLLISYRIGVRVKPAGTVETHSHRTLNRDIRLEAGLPWASST